MNPEKDVTILMTTYGMLDFTRAAIHSIRAFYPHAPFILADGSTDRTTLDWANYHGPVDSRIVHIPGGCYEDCLNSAAMLVSTPYLCIVNNNVKFTHPGGQLELMLEALAEDPAAVQSGAYAVKVVDWRKREALCGTRFIRHLEVDAFSGYLTLHKTSVFLEMRGQPKAHFYPDTPKEHDYEWASDLSLSALYKAANLKLITPKIPIPHIHWAEATEYMTSNPYKDWWYKHTHHRRIDPFDWKD